MIFHSAPANEQEEPLLSGGRRVDVASSTFRHALSRSLQKGRREKRSTPRAALFVSVQVCTPDYLISTSVVIFSCIWTSVLAKCILFLPVIYHVIPICHYGKLSQYQGNLSLILSVNDDIFYMSIFYFHSQA